MPFLRIDAYRGRSKSEVADLLDTIHRAVVEAFEVPERDRYQLYQEHDADHFIVQDTGLGIDRSRRTIVISMVSRPRETERKQLFYALLVEKLGPLGLKPEDIMVSIVVNGDADWSFGLGRAQFLTGELN
ncbi:MAG: tautomerase family protein [Rhizobiaceae bacterium]|nr:tautomerase family protein [Rhizobiaceae bacterium]